jgi:hypothetical protein
MTEPFECVATKSALQNISIGGPVKKRAPLFQFPNALWRLLRVNLRHTPIVQKFAAAHCVAKVRSPIIGPVNVGHRRRDATLSHDRVSFAKQRLADHSDACALGQCFDRRA